MSGFAVALEIYRRAKQTYISACFQRGRRQARNKNDGHTFQQVRTSKVLWRRRKQEGEKGNGNTE